MNRQTINWATMAMIAVLVAGCGSGSVSTAPGTSAAPSGQPASSTVPPPTPALDAPTRPSLPAATGLLTFADPSDVALGFTTPGKDVTITSAVTDPSMAGLTVDIPAAAYVDKKTVTVAAAPIDASSFGPIITPVSALFTIKISDSDGNPAAAAEPIEVRIPISLSSDMSAETPVAAFYYRPPADPAVPGATASLEGIPIIARDATSVTVITRHFSSIFISALKAVVEAGLPASIDSGFRPAADAWQFPNPGAQAAPKGYCSGDSTTAMWYFVTKYRQGGASRLYGLYDDNGGTKTPPFWQDDANGIRLAATVQAKTDWDSLAGRFFWRQQHISGDLAYDGLRYTIAVTGEPQLIFVKRPGGAHAMVVYKVDLDKIWISDPNFPGQERTAPYNDTTKVLGPYSGSYEYPTIIYAAKSAIVPWSDIAAEWARFEDGTIGNDVFAKSDFIIEHPADPASGTDAWTEPLVSGYTTTDPTVRLNVDTDKAASLFSVYGGPDGTTEIPSFAPIPLKIGDNNLGLFFQIPFFDGTTTELKWTQFKRYTVTRLAVETGWNLVGGGEISREKPDPTFYSWTTTGSAGSITSHLTSLMPTEFPPVPVTFSWTVPQTLVPFADLPSPKGRDGYLQIDPRVVPDGWSGVVSAQVGGFLRISDKAPPPIGGAGPGAYLKPDGTMALFEGAGVGEQKIPTYTDGNGSGAYSDKMWLTVEVKHEGAHIYYQYEYDWTGPKP
jgi:hypothetical protein